MEIEHHAVNLWQYWRADDASQMRDIADRLLEWLASKVPYSDRTWRRPL